jgi:ankyrin repeat protein
LIQQHWAAHNDIEHGHEIVKLLIEYGADVNQVSDTGLTPLDLARRAKRDDNVVFLEGVGAKTGAQMRMERREL